MTLACAAIAASGTTDWMALAIFGVPLLGIVLGRFLMGRSSTPARREPPTVVTQLPRFPLAERPPLAGEDEKRSDDLVGV